ncbi:MAG: hypothetical protein MHM6MM_002525 [Cercozoa sp. M6MM]
MKTMLARGFRARHPQCLSLARVFSTEPDAFEDSGVNRRFALSKAFLDKYKNTPPPFGFNGLGEFVYRRTYSRMKDDGTQEEWYETVARVVNGTYNMQKQWIDDHNLGWDPTKARKSAQEMYKRMFEMKFLPPGRGLWAMGSPLTTERGLYAALNNCAFVSTSDLGKEPIKPFAFLMDASMLGVGVGFDTKGAGTVVVKGVSESMSTRIYKVPDSREGWVMALRKLLESHFCHRAPVEFDFSLIRKAGEPIHGFGGVASGPEPLQTLLRETDELLRQRRQEALTATDIVDIMNLIGRCVVSGNVRRSAEIAFGDIHDEEYLHLKDYERNPRRLAFGWVSNNSVFARAGDDYTDVARRICDNGEPGLAWLDNMREYSRMRDSERDLKDLKACGGNPCLEQTLESFELCCLVETFPCRHEDLDDYLKTLKYAYLYAKTVTLGQTHWPDTNRVMLRNRRIGCSMSGIQQFVASKEPGKGLHGLKQWCEAGFDTVQATDAKLSDLFAIPRSRKTTSVKPSGTVSLLAGATPGMHWPESRFYIRRVVVAKNSPLLQPMQDAGYTIVDSVYDTNACVVEFPVDVGEGVRPQSEVSLWEQLCMASFLQHNWADNQVSCTVTFDPEKEGAQLPHAIEHFQYSLKGVSFLPRRDNVYEQMPYEPISPEEYERRLALLSTPHFADTARSSDDYVADKFCDGQTCEIPQVAAERKCEEETDTMPQ